MKLQKRIAAQELKCGIGRVRFDPEQLKEIKEAITTFDVKRLISKGTIYKAQKLGVSRARAKHRANQRKKGRQSGHGSRKGKTAARLSPKLTWVRGVRVQRDLIQRMRKSELINNETFKDLYAKIKGGFFRSTNHIKIFLEENDLINKANAKAK